MTPKAKAKEIEKLLEAKSAEEYVDISLKSRLGAGEKSWITRRWLKQSNTSVAELQYARNRHPKMRKLKRGHNHQQRTRERIERHNYSPADGQTRRWEKRDLRRFVQLNRKLADWELARQFERSLPAIQALRRKMRLITQLAEYEEKLYSERELVEMLQQSEIALKRRAEELKPPRPRSKRNRS